MSQVIPESFYCKTVSSMSAFSINFLLSVSLTAADLTHGLISSSVRQTGFGNIAQKSLTCLLFTICLFFTSLFSSALGQNVNVSDALTGNGTYATLADAFSAINSGAQTGTNIKILIQGNTTEPGAGMSLLAGAWNSVLIKPIGGVPRTISGNTSGAPMIDLDGADNVIIDGLNTEGNSLTITNTSISSTSLTSTIRLRSDATYNVLTRCSILGSSTGSLSSSDNGNIIFMSNASTTGNDFNVVSYCNIGPAGSNLPSRLIHFGGTTGSANLNNSGDTIRNCNIYDYFHPTLSHAGIYIEAGSTDIVIRDNRFYQTALRAITTSSVTHSAIRIENSSGNNFQVSDNIIGCSSSDGTGNYSLSFSQFANTFSPMELTVGTATSSSIQGNIIKAISISGSILYENIFKGINVINGSVNIGNQSGNIFGDSSSANSIEITGPASSTCSMYGLFLSGTGMCVTNNNRLYGIRLSMTNFGISKMYMIYSTLSNTWECSNNIIGSTLTNSISNTGYNPDVITNAISSRGGSAVISENLIRNINTLGGTIYGTVSAPFTGIYADASGDQTVSKNIIHTLTNTNTDLTGNGGAAHLIGIYFNSSSGLNVVEKNFIHSLKVNSNIGIVRGMFINSGSNEFRNNMTRIGIDGAGSGINQGCTFYGIWEQGGTNNFYFNSIYIGGNPVGPYNSSTWCVYSTSSSTRNYLNNIFFNGRSNNGSNGIHGTYRVNSLTGFTSNYNILYANGTGGIIGYTSGQHITMTNWRSVTSQDAQSKNANPQFFSAAGNSSIVDLHLSRALPTPAESNGTLVGSVTEDFDDQLRSSYSPHDIGADAGNFAQLDTAAISISYSLITSGNNSLSIPFTNVLITDANGVNGTSGTRPRVYYKKKSDANSYSDNTNSTPGWKFSEAIGAVSPFGFTIDFSKLYSAVNSGDTIQYFVVAQDLSNPVHAAINSGTFNEYPLDVVLSSSAFPVTGSVNSFVILPLNVNVTGALTGNGSFSTLSAAFNSINAGSQTSANISITVNGNTTEPSVGAILNSNDWNSLTISPAGGAARAILGAATSGLPLVDLNGADNVTIDGLNSGGNSLTISNTTFSFTSGTSTINFRNDASNNVVTRCTVLGSSAIIHEFQGAVINFGVGTTTGNDNNLISFCNIGPSTSGPSVKGISFIGSASASAFNSGDTIRNCNIYDHFYANRSSGIAILSGNTDITVKDNRIYQTVSRNFNPDAQLYGIRVDNSAGGNFKIIGNTIGYSSSNGTGTLTLLGSQGSEFNPIYINAGSAIPSSIQGNTIAAILTTGTSYGNATSAPFIGILVTGGAVNIGTETGNTIGNLSTNGSISFTSSSSTSSEVVGIHTAGSGSCSTMNNSIGSMQTANTSTGGANIFGIKNTSTGIWVCQNNTIGGSIANSIQTLSTATSTIMIGIQQTGGSSTISNNTVRNMTAAGGIPGVYAASAIGILVQTGNFSHTVSQNTIFGSSNTNATQSTVMSGLLFNSNSTSNIIERNFISAIAPSSNSSTLNGIQITQGTSTFRNNMISLGLNAQGNGVNNGLAINGIYETGGTNNFYFNSIYILGEPSSGAASSYGLRSIVTNNSRYYFNNILFNARSNNGSTGKHYAVSLGGAAPLPAGCVSDRNLLFSNGAGSVLGFFASADRSDLTAWRTASGLDSSSITGDPIFVDSSNLHIDSTQFSPVNNAGVNIAGISSDYDGDTRNSLTPDIGADEFNGFNPVITLNLNMFIEGFYDAASNLQVSDSITAYSRNPLTPYAIIDSARGIMNANGAVTLTFQNASSGNYYIVIKHRNSIETWSASAISMNGGGTTNYDFTNSAAQAYGSNLKQVDSTPIVFALFSGDVNQDETIDATDVSIVDNDAANYVGGYVVTDLTGDNFVDGTDFSIADNNAANYVSVIQP